MKKTFSFFLLFLITYSFNSWPTPNEINSKHATFSGRVSKLNSKAALVRVKVDFVNSKFLNNKDKVEFWSEIYPNKRCSSFVHGKSTEYILLKVPHYTDCVAKVFLTTGSYLHFYSTDLERNLKVARDLIDILLKKQMALNARLQRHQKGLDSYPEKVEAINQRYDVLREKLDLEWKNELSRLEEDKAFTYKNFQSTSIRLNEIEHKLEQYRIGDQNLKLDRWSLDPKLYIHK